MLVNSEEPCALLRLPVELRLAIFQGAILSDETDVTIGCETPVDTLWSTGNSFPRTADCHDILRTSARHAFIIRAKYDAALLSTDEQISHAAWSRYKSIEADSFHFSETTHRSLLGSCRKIREEMKLHFPILVPRHTNLFVQFPYGLDVFSSLLPQLAASENVTRLKSFHLVGIYRPQGAYCPRHRAAMPQSHLPSSSAAHRKDSQTTSRTGSSILPSRQQLTTFIQMHFAQLSLFYMRIYYPGPESYSTVWSDDDSIIPVALQAIPTAEIHLEIWRSTIGTGVVLHARPQNGSSSGGGDGISCDSRDPSHSHVEARRTVRTIWRRFEADVGEGKDGLDQPWKWIVDPQWPSWQAEYKPPDAAANGVTVMQSN